MRRIFGGAAVLLTAGPLAAQEADPVAGARLFVRFCSVCHGAGARGDGPMAPVLEVLPADLTQLMAENDGVFPIAGAAQKVDGRDPLLAHGGPMPLFGEFFGGRDVSVATESGQPLLASREIADILAFLRTIQAPPD